jgi:hypothetical protein
LEKWLGSGGDGRLLPPFAQLDDGFFRRLSAAGPLVWTEGNEGNEGFKR